MVQQERVLPQGVCVPEQVRLLSEKCGEGVQTTSVRKARGTTELLRTENEEGGEEELSRTRGEAFVEVYCRSDPLFHAPTSCPLYLSCGWIRAPHEATETRQRPLQKPYQP